MKALTIKQPWAWLILNAGKDVENRIWSTTYRGPMLIHAGLSLDLQMLKMLRDAKAKNSERLGFDLKTVPFLFQRGAIIGVADLVDVRRHHPSLWFEGPWGWVLENPRVFRDPVPYKGKLGLFDVPDCVVAGQF